MLMLRIVALLASLTTASASVAHGQAHQHQHLHLRVHQLPFSPAPAAAGPAEEEDPDKLAMDTFVRKCTVAFSVQHADNLPTNALQNFCESTDAVMECRLKLLQPLKEAHKRGGSMMIFCATAYNWFQMKYGMYCPTQCDKMQCKSTCEWLDEKKALDWEGEKLEESSAAVAGSRKEVDDLESELVDAREAATMRNRSVAQGEVNLARADAALKEKQAALEWQGNASTAVDGKVQSLESQKEALALNMTADEDSLAELKMRVEKADLATHLLKNEQQRLSAEAGEAAAKMTDSEHQLEKSEEEMRVLEQMTNEEDGKAQEIERKVDNATAEVADRRVKLEAAEAQLEGAKANNDTNAEINELLDLVRQQKQRFDAAREAFRLLDRELTDKRISLEHSRQDIGAYRSSTAGLRNQTDAIRRAVVALEEQLVAKDADVEAGHNVSSLLTSEVATRTAALAALREQAGSVDRSVELQRHYQQQEHEALEKAQAAEQQAHDELKLQEAELGQEFHALEAAATAMGEALHKVAQEKQTWESENSGLVHALAAHKEKERDLGHRKPEIVRMHGLGLVQLLG